MKKIAYILRLIFPKYRKFAFLHFAFILLSTLFGLFSFTMVMPFLSILFKTQEPVTTLVEWHANFESLKHNLYYYLSKLTENDPGDALIYVSAMMVFFVLLKTGFLYLSRFFLVPIRNGIIKDIRNKIYRKILSLHIGYFSNERKGDIISRTTADVQEVESSIVGSLTIIFKDPVSIVMSVIILLSMSVKLTIVAFLVLPLSGLVIAAVGKSLRRKSLKAQNKLGELISIIEETLGGLRIIHAFNAQSKVNDRFNAENDKYTKILNSVIRRRDLAVPVSEFLATTAIVILLVLGGTLIINGGIDMPPEDFFAFILIFSQVIQPVKDISGAWYSILKGFASVDRIDKILLAEPAIQDKPDAISVDGFQQSIRYKDVSFRYRNDYVLKKINFELQKGKTIALVGQSGSGKTTLVNLLPRFYELLEGSIEIDGADIRTLKINDLRGLMGVVNQESILFNDTIFNNIAFGVETATEEEVIAAARVANAHDFIMETPEGYQTNIGDRGDKLSGGQKQRISIARAVLANPPIMILDEATSALDTESERLVQDALTRLMQNRTSIIIAHRLSTIVNADEIFVMQDGEIIERGRHEDLIKLNGTYRKLHDLQVFS